MNSSTTKVLHAMALLNAHGTSLKVHGANKVTRCAPAKSRLCRAAAWLKTLCACRAGFDDRLFLYCLVDDCGPDAKPPVRAGTEDQLFLYSVDDHCDLERRISQIDRRRAQSGYAVGAARF